MIHYNPLSIAHNLFKFVGLAAAYAAMARLVLSFALLHGNLTLLWLPGGMALAALLAWGWRFWPSVFVGAWVAGVVAGDPWTLAALIALGNSLETVLATLLLQRVKDFDIQLSKNSDFIQVVCVGAASSLISATIGPISLLLYGYLPEQAFWHSLFIWWQADVIGILLGTPFFLVWRNAPVDWLKYPNCLSALVFFAILLIAGQIIFLDGLHEWLSPFAHGYWCFLFVSWAARSFGRHGVLLVVAIVTVQALFGAVYGLGFFSSDIARSGLQNLWLYITVLTVTGLPLAINLDQLKLAQQDLRAQKINLTAFFDNSPIGIHVFDVDGKVLTVNRAAKDMLGIDDDAALGHDCLFDDPAISPQTKGALKAGLVATEERFIDLTPDKNASYRQAQEKLFISLNFTPCLNENREPAGYIASIVDQTEHHAREHQIHLLNQAYAALAETNRAARHARNETDLFNAICQIAVEVGGFKMAWIGIKSGGGDRINPLASYGEHTDSLQELHISIDGTRLEGKGPTGTALREGYPVVLQEFYDSTMTYGWQIGAWQSCGAFPILKNKRPYAVFTLYHAERNTFNELVFNLLTAMSADISFSLEVIDKEADRQRVMLALSDNENRFRAIFNQAAVGLAQIETATGRFLWANPVFETIVGMPLEQIKASTFMSITHPSDLSTNLDYMEQLKSGQIKSFSMENRYFRPDGSILWVNLSVTPMWQPGTTPNFHIAAVQDITERKLNEEKLHLMARIFEATLEGIVITDAQHTIIEVNEAFCQITGYSYHEVVGKTPRFLKSGHHSKDFYRFLWQTVAINGHWSGEVWNRRKNGEVYPEWLTISVITDPQGQVTHYVGISSDITLLKQREKQLEQVAHYDSLTGIPNRVLFTDRLQQAMSQTRREKTLLAICYLDLDGFKPINDTWGHEIGDQVLIKIAERLGHNLRGGDTLARLGGDEFVILLLNIEDNDDCQVSLGRLLKAIQLPISIDDQYCSVTASIGVTLYPFDDNDPDTLLRHADQAMYLAKQTGKNRYHIFDPQQDTQVKINHELRSRIEEGLAAGEFELFFQPKISMTNGYVVGVEALLRWQHPQRGLLTPSAFLPILDNSLLEIKLGDWVVGKALAQLEVWRQLGFELGVSVNLSAPYLQTPHFIDDLKKELSLFPALAPSQLQIEILETAALADIGSVSQIIEACNQLGVSFALDDFGTGYSSLAYLRKLPAGALKIDQTFVRDMLVDPGDYAIVQGIIALAQTFKRITIAEGVESWEHFRVLRDMGCDVGQGYGIARPMKAEDLTQWVVNWKLAKIVGHNDAS